jgi:MFS family permease
MRRRLRALPDSTYAASANWGVFPIPCAAPIVTEMSHAPGPIGKHAARMLRQANRIVTIMMLVELFSSLALGAAATALGWQAFSRRHDPLVLGLLGLAEFIPAAVLALPAGHVIDRHDRRVVAGAGLVASTVVALGLALDAAAGDTAVWPLYLLAFAWGIGNAFVGPTLGTLLAAGVAAPDLARSVAVTTSAGQAAIVAGPALGGITQTVGAPAPYLFAAVCAATAAALMALVPARVGVAHVGEREPRLSDVLEGVRLIARTRPLLGAISLDLMAVLFGGATALLPVFARDILHVGAVGNGLLRAAPGVGAVLVGAVISTRPLNRRVGKTLFGVVALFGVFTIVFGLSRSFVLSLFALGALAGADMVSMVVRSTLAPMLTPPALRGRVSAVERVFIGASNELGAFESGSAAALIGAVPAVVLGGAASIAVALIWAWGFPELRRIDRFDELRPTDARAAPDP